MNTDTDSAAQAIASLPVVVIGLILGVLTIVALWKIFTKAGEHGWASIVPLYNTYVQFRIAGFNPWLFLLLLIPVVNVVMAIIVAYRIGIAFGKSPVWSVFMMVILSTIGLLVLGFGSATYDRSRIA